MNPLGELLKARIEREGPISLHDYMEMAVSHPEHGYYARQNPFGAEGDFITAPEASQMFGELIGLWAVDVWVKLGQPGKFYILELGPGNGTLMGDALRSARLVPEFLAAAEIHLIETSARLKERQAETLDDHDIHWHDELPDLVGAPIILIANEFFDALPIHQYSYQSGTWVERMITLRDGKFAYQLADTPVAITSAPSADDNDILELCLAGDRLIEQISKLIFREGGAALIIDYGATETILGDSFQAMKRHEYADPLASPGEADLTTHVRFSNLREIALSCGITVQGPIPQGRFLERLGIEARHHQLKKNAGEVQRKNLDTQLRRLISSSEMGTLFKVMALSHNTSAATEGFGS
ncbi:SAM-dependent methyltransferase [uncultured Sneathiella sp.]|uniref:class I SAM-dependent methyltransferase n=1 Tax=uncultured Sneathiella sp. TaxID=879315 RepID=UPI0030EE41A4|tara:strand:+ start:378 stop:1442 length:1065 start_codon:yes stop_codon:yes gene_type:complete